MQSISTEMRIKGTFSYLGFSNSTIMHISFYLRLTNRRLIKKKLDLVQNGGWNEDKQKIVAILERELCTFVTIIKFLT